ncbi:hypothetical protein [Pengzhenrongella sp.]|uniref:hypothetical protein n=1 Tax=Pengzhenrongella sp. TaxID=2888820 RepID=UPI002F92F46A
MLPGALSAPEITSNRVAASPEVARLQQLVEQQGAIEVEVERLVADGVGWPGESAGGAAASPATAGALSHLRLWLGWSAWSGT